MEKAITVVVVTEEDMRCKTALMTALEKAKITYDSMVRKYGATSAHTADARDKYMGMIHRTSSDEEGR